MKKILMILVIAVMALRVSAQKVIVPRYYSQPRVYVTTGFYPPLYPYSYYGMLYPYPYAVHPYRETKLERKIDDIKRDYQDRIWSARHNKTLSRKERKTTIHELNHERDQAILDAKQNYYKSKR
jgi:hypothetical protein